MVLKNIKAKQGSRGFTIVELLVVIVVIGILAAITIVSYTGITTKANTAAGQSEANAAAAKINIYSVDTAYGMPTTYGSINNSSSNTSYYAAGINFTTASNNVAMSTKPAQPDAIDFSLCGTASAAAATSYATITVPTGVKIAYWDQGLGSLNTNTSIGITSGTYTNGYNITCYKVGLAEATIAVARAMYNENSSTWPATAASIQANTASSAKLAAGMTVGLVNPTSGNGTTTVKFECGSAVAATSPCNNTGGRITFWDYGAGAVATVTYGSATNFWTPAS